MARDGPATATPSAKGELGKLAWLRGMDADTLDLPVLPAGRQRFPVGLGRRLTAQNIERRDDRKDPILLTWPRIPRPRCRTRRCCSRNYFGMPGFSAP